MGQDGYLGLARDNIRIKMIIIIILKLVLVVEPREGKRWVTNREG